MMRSLLVIVSLLVCTCFSANAREGKGNAQLEQNAPILPVKETQLHSTIEVLESKLSALQALVDQQSQQTELQVQELLTSFQNQQDILLARIRDIEDRQFNFTYYTHEAPCLLFSYGKSLASGGKRAAIQFYDSQIRGLEWKERSTDLIQWTGVKLVEGKGNLVNFYKTWEPVVRDYFLQTLIPFHGYLVSLARTQAIEVLGMNKEIASQLALPAVSIIVGFLLLSCLWALYRILGICICRKKGRSGLSESVIRNLQKRNQSTKKKQ